MDMDRYIGRLLDNRYEILEVIGIGGMAVVYKARCHRLNRLVAVKILKDDYIQDEEFRNRFHAESQAVAMLSHPNIVSVYDVSATDDADYIVMELIDGITLKQYMEKKGVLNWKETLHFAIQIGKALDHAHSRGIVHRDIKPHNVMVLKNGSVKVADFGIARVMSKSNTLTKEALGSVHYISPEQAKGGRVDSRSDIYSLGVVMYEMMTGRPPYDGETPVSVAIQHINGKASMPSTINPNIPGGLEQIIMKAMEQSPANRYATTSALLYDMDEFRKNPTILFDYNNPNTDMDAAARLTQVKRDDEQKTAPLPKPPVPQEPRKPAAPAAKPRTSAAATKKQPPKRRREEIIEDDEGQESKIATIAVISCVAVALLAVVIFVIAMLSGGLSSQGELVYVPDLIGKTQEQLGDLEVTVRVGDRAHNGEYELGQIYDQNPKAGTRIARGGVVTIYISLGQEQNITMKGLVGYNENAALNYLTGTLGIDRNNIKFHSENSAEYGEGTVTRTDPAEGEIILEGETVHVWVSKGPEIKMKKVPNLYGKTQAEAERLLVANEFTNYVFVEVKSNQPEGTVVGQSIQAQQEVNVTTEITVQISMRQQQETTPPEETEPPIPSVDPDLKTKIMKIDLPEGMMEEYTLSIWVAGDMLQERQIPVGSLSTEFALTGKGKVEYTVKVNGSDNNSWTIEVDFDAE